MNENLDLTKILKDCPEGYEYLNQKETVWELEIEKDLNVK